MKSIFCFGKVVILHPQSLGKSPIMLHIMIPAQNITLSPLVDTIRDSSPAVGFQTLGLQNGFHIPGHLIQDAASGLSRNRTTVSFGKNEGSRWCYSVILLTCRGILCISRGKILLLMLLSVRDVTFSF